MSENYEDLTKLIEPEISVDEVKNSIETLEKLNLIQKNESGFYRSTENFLTVEDLEMSALMIRNLLHSFLLLKQ